MFTFRIWNNLIYYFRGKDSSYWRQPLIQWRIKRKGISSSSHQFHFHLINISLFLYKSRLKKTLFIAKLLFITKYGVTNWFLVRVSARIHTRLYSSSFHYQHSHILSGDHVVLCSGTCRTPLILTPPSFKCCTWFSNGPQELGTINNKLDKKPEPTSLRECASLFAERSP